MGLFSRSRGAARGSGNQTADMVARLERFGRHMYDVAENPSPWPSASEDFVLPIYRQYQADQDAFLTALADMAEEYQGWTAYGAERLMIDVAGGNLEHPAYGRIMEASLRFLRASGVPPMKTTGYEWQHWIATGGTNETWVPRRPPPTSADAPISELGPSETRKVAQLTAADDSNLIFVQRGGSNRYVAIVDARYSDEDPRRAQNEFYSSDSLYDLYMQIALPLQIPPYWCDREILPYFPLPRPRF
jgi:hypothetical protein